jgi:hypothetical protein
VQAAWVVIVQAPVAKQHAPSTGGGGGQVFGTQTPLRVHTPGAGQSTCVVTVQLPSGMQQEPDTGG